MGKATLIDLRAERGARGGSPPPRPPGDDEPPVLYARRKQIYPKLAFGRVRSIK